MLASDAILELQNLPTCIIIQDIPGYRYAVHNLHNGMLVAMPSKAMGLSMSMNRLADDLAVVMPIHELTETGKVTKTQFINYIHGKDIKRLVDTWKAQAIQLGLLDSKQPVSS